MTGFRASGMVDVRGFEIGKSSDEIRAALSDAKSLRDDPDFTSEMLNLWGNSAGAKDRFRNVQEIELRSFQHMYAKEIA